MAKRGRKKQFDTEAWGFFSMQAPKELLDALHEYAHAKKRRKSELVREFMERLLEKEGYIKVITRESRDGRKSKSYVALRVYR